MLISDDLKLICLGDKSLEDKFVKKFFKTIGFEETSDDNENYSKFYLSIDPYQKILNFYMDVVLSSKTPIFKDKMDDYVVFFREWISKMFYFRKLIVKLRFDGTDEKYTKILSSFTNVNPHNIFFIRDKDFNSDIKKINNELDFGFEKLRYKWRVDEFYDYNTAKIIFQFYKNDFFLGHYNPFSFSSHNLNLNDRIDFIHKPF